MRTLETEFEAMVRQCTDLGFAPLHAQAIIQIVQRASARGGLDHSAMEELAQLPKPCCIGKLCLGHKVMVFGFLSAWSLGIAGLMVFASKMI